MKSILDFFHKRSTAPAQQLKLSVLATYLWGLLAHGYLFMSISISHDSLDDFIVTNYELVKKASLGRVFVTAMAMLRGRVAAPWLIGLLGLGFLGIAVYLVVRIFDIEENWEICLLSGILTVNVTMIALVATYVMDFDCDCLALLCAVAAVSCWKKPGKKYWLGAIPIVGLLGLYQSYLSVVIVLILFVCILSLLQGQKVKNVFRGGMAGIGMILLGGIGYFVLIQLASLLTGVNMNTGSYNSMGQALKLTPATLLPLMLESWKLTFTNILEVVSMYPKKLSYLMQAVAIGGSVLMTLVLLWRRKIGALGSALVVLGFWMLPLGANVSRILTNGMSHDLMNYAMWLIYLLLMLLGRELAKERFPWPLKNGGLIRALAALLVAAVAWGNVQVANAVYVEKRFVQQANLSLFTRILYDVERTQGYSAWHTPVVFVGWPDSYLIGMPNYLQHPITGNTTTFVMGSGAPQHYQSYMRNVLLHPMQIAEEGIWWDMQEREDVKKMPKYPEQGAIAMLDGVLVIKLGEN